MQAMRRDFERTGDGPAAVLVRATLVDDVIAQLWSKETTVDERQRSGIALAAVGGYGRRQLFPNSDIDLLICVEKAKYEGAKEALRWLSQGLWDFGLQVAMSVRQPQECERFDAANPEAGLSLLDARFICGDEELFARLREKHIAKMMAKDAKAIGVELAKLTSERHKRYGYTLFHLEPNVKECPGGLRDAHVCEWLRMLRGGTKAGDEFTAAEAFLTSVRCYLHLRHGRDDNVLDWLAQDGAAEQRVGLGKAYAGTKVDASWWMRAYFRNARIVERSLLRGLEESGLRLEGALKPKRIRLEPGIGYAVAGGWLELDAARPGNDPAHEPGIVLAAFATMAGSGIRLSPQSEERIAAAIPVLSANLEEGPGLWWQLDAILTGERAATALRAMHALGVLDLILPEFHGIDALVIRDAYHRYTVDEHTFVLVETLHGLEQTPPAGAPDWRVRLGAMAREMSQKGLLYLAALLHDTGKGRAGDDHAALSRDIAVAVLDRLEMEAYERGLVLRLIELHLEMSNALRRDIFDAATVKMFAAKVQSHELLRMLTLFTYADIAAVHPDAMTPWKAENLWRLSMAAANQLDRNIDDERVQAGAPSLRQDEAVSRLVAIERGDAERVGRFLEGFPERYVRTRSPETVQQHMRAADRFTEEPYQILFNHGGGRASGVSEITLITQDRPRLFAGVAGALAAWGMNIVTADAFANAAGIVVDSFRFTDTFKTLDLNVEERERFVESVRGIVAGRVDAAPMLAGRKRSRRRAPKIVVETRIEFDDTASSHSTLMQVVAQDVPGLLYALAKTISAAACNVEVAVVDTEGETAIDVFYLTKNGGRLTHEEERTLRAALLEAMDANAK